METTATKIAAKAGIDINSILAILAAFLPIILNLFKSCPTPTPPTPKEAVNMIGTFRGRLALRQALLANDIKPLSAQGRAVIEAFLSEVPNMTDEDAAEFMAHCEA